MFLNKKYSEATNSFSRKKKYLDGINKNDNG